MPTLQQQTSLLMNSPPECVCKENQKPLYAVCNIPNCHCCLLDLRFHEQEDPDSQILMEFLKFKVEQKLKLKYLNYSGEIPDNLNQVARRRLIKKIEAGKVLTMDEKMYFEKIFDMQQKKEKDKKGKVEKAPQKAPEKEKEKVVEKEKKTEKVVEKVVEKPKAEKVQKVKGSEKEVEKKEEKVQEKKAAEKQKGEKEKIIDRSITEKDGVIIVTEHKEEKGMRSTSIKFIRDGDKKKIEQAFQLMKEQVEQDQDDECVVELLDRKKKYLQEIQRQKKEADEKAKMQKQKQQAQKTQKSKKQQIQTSPKKQVLEKKQVSQKKQSPSKKQTPQKTEANQSTDKAQKTQVLQKTQKKQKVQNAEKAQETDKTVTKETPPIKKQQRKMQDIMLGLFKSFELHQTRFFI